MARSDVPEIPKRFKRRHLSNFDRLEEARRVSSADARRGVSRTPGNLPSPAVRRKLTMKGQGMDRTAMAHGIYLNADLGCIVARFSGEVGMAELDQVRREIEVHPDFRPGLNRVWDERDCTLTLSASQVTELAERWATSPVRHGRRRLAYFVTPGMPWGFNRLFEGQRNAPEVTFELFTEWRALKAWLDLPEDLPDPAELVPMADD